MEPRWSLGSSPCCIRKLELEAALGWDSDSISPSSLSARISARVGVGVSAVPGPVAVPAAVPASVTDGSMGRRMAQ
jgi:hypothetical protein